GTAQVLEEIRDGERYRRIDVGIGQPTAQAGDLRLVVGWCRFNSEMAMPSGSSPRPLMMLVTVADSSAAVCVSHTNDSNTGLDCWISRLAGAGRIAGEALS